MNSKEIEFIKESIRKNLGEVLVYVVGDEAGEHFQAIVVSNKFVGKSLIEQHQMVMNPLRDSFRSDHIHALALKTFTPSAWDRNKDRYIKEA